MPKTQRCPWTRRLARAAPRSSRQQAQHDADTPCGGWAGLGGKAGASQAGGEAVWVAGEAHGRGVPSHFPAPHAPALPTVPPRTRSVLRVSRSGGKGDGGRAGGGAARRVETTLGFRAVASAMLPVAPTRAGAAANRPPCSPWTKRRERRRRCGKRGRRPWWRRRVKGGCEKVIKANELCVPKKNDFHAGQYSTEGGPCLTRVTLRCLEGGHCPTLARFDRVIASATREKRETRQPRTLAYRYPRDTLSRAPASTHHNLGLLFWGVGVLCFACRVGVCVGKTKRKGSCLSLSSSTTHAPVNLSHTQRLRCCSTRTLRLGLFHDRAWTPPTRARCFLERHPKKEKKGNVRFHTRLFTPPAQSGPRWQTRC